MHILASCRYLGGDGHLLIAIGVSLGVGGPSCHTQVASATSVAEMSRRS